jgi:heat shock protein HslJ
MRRAAVIAAAAVLSACATAMSTAALQNTYWKLLRIGSEAVSVAEGQREPHLVLHGQGRGLVGFSGCNRVSGSFTLDGETIHFGDVVTSRMACANDAALRQEQRFLDVLPRTARWRIAGERLDLLDRDGAVLASFESVYLR